MMPAPLANALVAADSGVADRFWSHGSADPESTLGEVLAAVNGLNAVSGPDPRVDVNGRFTHSGVSAGRYRLDAHATVFDRRPGSLSDWPRPK
jgi:hypothetical protein